MKNASNSLEEFDIEFVKLKDGIYHFQHEIGNSFFEAFESKEVKGASIHCAVTFDKRNQMMQVDLAVDGTIVLQCDRCLVDLGLPVKDSYRMIYKIREAEATQVEDGFELVYITHNEIKINTARHIYETILLGLPIIRNCDDLEVKPCDEEMLVKIEKLNEAGNEESDPRWNKLKDFLK